MSGDCGNFNPTLIVEKINTFSTAASQYAGQASALDMDVLPIEPGSISAGPIGGTLPAYVRPSWKPTRPSDSYTDPGAPGAAPTVNLGSFGNVGTAPDWTEPSGLGFAFITSVPTYTGGMTAPAPVAYAVTVTEHGGLSLPAALALEGLGDVDIPEAGDAPEWDGDPIEFDTSGAPVGNLDLGDLDVPDIDVPDIGDVPEYDKPLLPTLTTLVPIEFEGLEPLDLDVTLPDADALPSLSNTFNYVEDPWAPDTMPLLMGEVAQVINGRMAIPQWVWSGIWARTAGDLARQAAARRREARRGHARLGWSMPGGTMLAGMLLADTEINEQISAKAFEQATQQALMQREDFWQAMQQGIAGETLLLQADTAHKERLLRAAVEHMQASIAVYNALVGRFNAELQGVQVLVAAKQLQLQASLAEIEVYKAQLEGEKLKGEIDRNAVALYTAQWDGVKAQVSAYEAWVKSVEANISAQRATVEVYGEQVRAQNNIVAGWAAQWDAYAKKIEAERLKLGAYETEAQIFGVRVQAYQAKVQAGGAKASAQVGLAQAKVARMGVDAQRYSADVQLETAKVGLYDAYVRLNGVAVEASGVNVQGYAAEVQLESTKVNAWAAGYDALEKLNSSEGAKAQALNAYASVYGARVQAFGSTVQAETARMNVLEAGEKLKLAGYVAEVQKYTAEANAIASKISALAGIYGSEAQVYAAEIQGEAASVNAQAQAYSVGIQEAELHLTASVEFQKLRAQFYDSTTRAEAAVISSKGSVLAQIGSAAYAAAQVSLSNSNNESLGCTTNYSYDMTG